MGPLLPNTLGRKPFSQSIPHDPKICTGMAQKLALPHFDTVAQPYLIGKGQKESPLEISTTMQVWRQEEKKEMSLKPEPIGSIPPETIRVAKAAFPNGHLFMKIRDELGTLYRDEL